MRKTEFQNGFSVFGKFITTFPTGRCVTSRLANASRWHPDLRTFHLACAANQVSYSQSDSPSSNHCGVTIDPYRTIPTRQPSLPYAFACLGVYAPPKLTACHSPFLRCERTPRKPLPHETQANDSRLQC